MPDIDQEIQIHKAADFSGGVQRKSSRFSMQDKEAWEGINSDFDNIGGVGKKLGYTQQGSNLTTTTSSSTSTSTTTTSTSTSTTTSTSTSTTTTA